MYHARPYTPRDLTPLMTLNRRCFSMPWSAQAVQYDAEKNNQSEWVLLEAPADPEPSWERWLSRVGLKPRAAPLVGFGAFWVLHGEAHITSLGVAPEQRGQGLGEVVLSTLLAWAGALGARYSTLEVRVSNQQAQQLYYKYSYRITGRKPGYYHDDGEDAYVMRTRDFDDLAYQRLLRWRVDQLRQRVQWSDAFAPYKHRHIERHHNRYDA